MNILEYAARFLSKKFDKQNTYCFCPGCGLELCNSLSWYTDTDLVRYRCIKCGHDSAWLFDAPAPILIGGKIIQ